LVLYDVLREIASVRHLKILWDAAIEYSQRIYIYTYGGKVRLVTGEWCSADDDRRNKRVRDGDIREQVICWMIGFQGIPVKP